MLCEHANLQLVEYIEAILPPDLHAQVQDHLQGCASCQAEYEVISRMQAQMQTMASNWHDEIVPGWKPQPISAGASRDGGGRDILESLRMWFPTAASTAALAMATLIFIQMPQTNGILPANGPATAQSATSYESLPPLPQARQAALQEKMVQSVMEGSREQRQEELQALLKILKAEMDRRSIETEESLRFVITNQLQGQEELDELYKQVEGLMQTPASAASSTNPAPTGVVNR